MGVTLPGRHLGLLHVPSQPALFKKLRQCRPSLLAHRCRWRSTLKFRDLGGRAASLSRDSLNLILNNRIKVQKVQMPSFSFVTLLQIVVGLGLLNVWLLRSRSATAYRGGDSQTLKAEFAAYGLPEWMFFVVGGLKIAAAIALIAGIWLPALVAPAAAVVVVLMIGAVAMHFKVKDPAIKSLPAFLVLVMSAAILIIG